MSKKKKRKVLKYERCLLLVIGFLIVSLVVLLSLSFMKNKDPIFKVESRVSQLQEEMNKETQGFVNMSWLKVQGTNIDLPIVRSLVKDSSEKYPVQIEKFGWTMEPDDNYHNVVNLMGHNIFNLSANPMISEDSFHRFEDVMAFVYEDFAKDNKYIQYTIDGEDYIYKIFAASFVYPLDVELLPTGDYTESQVKDYIKFVKENSIYDYDVSVNSNDDLVAVITCTRMFGTDGTSDFMIVGRRVHDDEVLDNYKVSKNDNYKRVEKVMKGDDVNEE
ncbi:MAG: class B sortase [Bacilli bacterium]|nr:class B sortase [Bacilli bacterium]